MAGPWSLDKLAAVAGETEDRIRRYADAGLLHQQANGELEPDSLHRLRLIQFARSRGVTDEQLAAATARQGDLLGIFDEHAPLDSVAGNLVDAARESGLDDAVFGELVEILDWDVEAGTESDIAILRGWARALALGMSRDAVLQLARVFADTSDRLADAIVRTFHNYAMSASGPRG
jgi:adenylate cyclase